MAPAPVVYQDANVVNERYGSVGPYETVQTSNYPVVQSNAYQSVSFNHNYPQQRTTLPTQNDRS